MIHQQGFSLIQQLLASYQQDHGSNKVPNGNRAEIRCNNCQTGQPRTRSWWMTSLVYLESFPITSTTWKHFAWLNQLTSELKFFSFEISEKHTPWKSIDQFFHDHFWLKYSVNIAWLLSALLDFILTSLCTWKKHGIHYFSAFLQSN